MKDGGPPYNLENPLKGLQSGNPTPTAEPTVSDGGAGSPGYNPPQTKVQRSQWRARRRYDSFMRLREVCPDLTFHDFLTKPEWKERRDGC